MLRFQLKFAISRQTECPKTAVIGQNDQFLDSAYHRRPEAEPDIKSGMQGCLFVPLTRHQILIPNESSFALNSVACTNLLDFLEY